MFLKFPGGLESDRYCFSNELDLRDSKDALQVNWCELTTTDAEGNIIYHNAFITDHEIHRDNVAAIIEDGRARWKTESAPQAHKVMIKGLIMKCCKAVGKMMVGPSKSVVRSRFQTTPSGCY